MTSPIAMPATSAASTLAVLREDARRRMQRVRHLQPHVSAGLLPRKLVGIEVEGDALPFELSRKCVARHHGEPVGTVTDLIWSPRLTRNIGYV